MSDTTGDAQAEAAMIAKAVEKVLHPEPATTAAVTSPARSDDEKHAAAKAIYLAWRNASLGDLPTESFNRVEAESGTLISAIADHLT